MGGRGKRVAIVGGGAGGLMAAWHLQRKSLGRLEIVVFEADRRLGGKIWTESFSSASASYEAGIAELYRYGNDPLWRLVDGELGLKTIPLISGGAAEPATPSQAAGQQIADPDVTMFGSTVMLGDCIVRDRNDLCCHFGSDTWHELRDFHRLACEMCSSQEFHQDREIRHPWIGRSAQSLIDEIADPHARRYLETLVHSDLAVELHQTSALYWIENFLINDERYCELYTVEGGLERVIDALAERITASVRLRCPVRAVRRTEAGGYRVAFEQSGLTASEQFDCVVFALPLNWLQAIDWENAGLRRAMGRHNASYDHPAHYLRVSMLFERPFWREIFDECFVLHDSFGGCCIYDESSRLPSGGHGVLGWLLSGNDAVRMSNYDDRELVKRVLQALPPAFAEGKDLFREGRVHRWIGTVCGQPGGPRSEPFERRHRMRRSQDPGLILVGDYLFDTTVNGVLDSADVASNLVLRYLEIPVDCRMVTTRFQETPP